MSVIMAGSTRYTLDEAVGMVLDGDIDEDSGEEEIQEDPEFPLTLEESSSSGSEGPSSEEDGTK